MSAISNSSNLRCIGRRVVVTMFVLFLMTSPALYGKDKKKQQKPEANAEEPALKKIYASLDKSKIVWPNPPAITRIRYLSYWAGEKYDEVQAPKKKTGWMEKMSGIATGETAQSRPKWELVVPNGLAVDSKKRVYIADSKVRAIFVVNSDTGEFDMIKSGVEAKFQWLIGLAIDDADRLFVSDSGLKRVLIFDPNHKLEGVIDHGLVAPGGLAIDNENRVLYVSDAEQDLVFAFDADPPYKLIRKIGKEGTNHTSTVPGEFSKPTGVAVDQDGNLYVSDTWNNRIEIFDADGKFIRAFGKVGDGPGFFSRPKGLALDADGHLWVCDQVQSRVQVFTPEGRLLIYMGEAGALPGQFQSLVNIAIDKDNRVFTTEQYMGRMQMFRYITDSEAKAEKDRRDTELKKKIDEARAKAASAKAQSGEPKN